jgi:phosphate butyryltransferase
MLNRFEEIEDRVKSANEKKRVIIWDADDSGWLKVLKKYDDEGLAEVTLLGDESKIRKSADDAGVDISNFELRKTSSIEDTIAHIKQALADKQIDILVRGTVGIKDSLKALFAKDVGFRVGRTVVSAVSCHYVEDIKRMLIVTDPVIIPAPDLMRKIAMIGNAVSFANHLGDEMPKVALLAAVEAVYPVMPHTIEAAAIAKMNDRGQIKGCLVEGPLSMDCAVIESAAKSKGVKGEVGGKANILVAPNIETAYGMYKAFSRFVGAPTGIVIVGGIIPICMASRSDSEETKENSLLLAMS